MRTRRRGPHPKGRMLLTSSERKKLRRMVRRYSLPFRMVQRAKIILELNRDPCVNAAAHALGVDIKLVRRWRDRFLKEGRIKALEDRPRSGRPPEIDPVSRCEIIAMACGRPSDFGESTRQVWSISCLRDSFVALHPDGAQLSRSSVFGILNKAELRPHRKQMWLHSPDPRFREKVSEICELYINPPPDSIVLCIDEKPGMQALGRKHPPTLPEPGRLSRFDFEYVRNGTLKLLAAFDVHSAEVYAEVRPRRTAADLVEFMEAVAEQFPEKTIHVIWDNLNIHYDGPKKRWRKFNRRHSNRFHFHYTPVHASWVNQVELFFSILQRRVLRYGVFNSLEELKTAVLAFISCWNQEEAHPFQWTFKGYPLQSAAKAA